MKKGYFKFLDYTPLRISPINAMRFIARVTPPIKCEAF